MAQLLILIKFKLERAISSTTEGHVRMGSLTEEESEHGAASFHPMMA